MTAENFDIVSNKILPEISSESGKTIEFILQTIKDACLPFKKTCTQTNLKKPLNENKLTQIFVEQIEVKIKSHPCIGVKNQYSDLFYNTKGIPDFYFHIIEEGVTHEPLFIVESKRLPSPSFEKEYVIGDNANGGIERFKIEKHGKGLNQCGLLGFIEINNSNYWLKTINFWIQELSNNNGNWRNDEVLTLIDNYNDYTYLVSSAHRPIDIVSLHHFWVK
jgi:hypothetical protein